MNMEGSTMVGIGLTMEAINQNPILYELALDHIWEAKKRDLRDWLKIWVHARYNLFDEEIFKSWKEVVDTVYDVKDPAQGNGFWGVTKSILCLR